MNKIIKKFQKSIREDISHGHALIVSGMLFLIFAQLIWWIVFFEINQQKTRDQLQRYHSLFEEILSGKINPEKYRDILVKNPDGTLSMKAELTQFMQEEHKKYLIMLISETSFTLLLISYGSFRVIRSIRSERKLVNERNIFMNSVSHELKTPLSTILLNLQTLLKRPGLKDSDKKEMLQEGVESVRRLEEQVNNLLLGGEILRNKSKHRGYSLDIIEECDSVKVIHKYLSEHAIYFKNHRVAFHSEIPDSLKLHISGDLLYKVLSNLISNAVQYSGERPEITLRLKIDEDRSGHCILTVTDRGPGIPDEELDNIFKPLYRLSDSSSPVRGTGMGLYIVKEIVKSCGGTIKALSGHGKIGTQFDVRLPLAG